MNAYITQNEMRQRGSRGTKEVLLWILMLGMVALPMAAAREMRHKENLAQNIFRLHVVANSDSAEDQAIKLAVRDRILRVCGAKFTACRDSAEAETVAALSCAEIAQTALRALRRMGDLHRVSVSVGTARFPTRCYGGVRLPAGQYRALQVRIGAAEGQNWWCVLYPPLCLHEGTIQSDAETLARLRRSLSAEEYALITETERITINMRFRILEILGQCFPTMWEGRGEKGAERQKG